ncbi:MAG: LysR family transcriptional regulator [Rhodoferax sp.]|uniref:LysR family transcriptional regulator n=1 Tax=Rhodoferax sp. TaxID=50421 RepID=UPI0032665FF0
MLDLNDIALFVQVVEAGSFAAAARRLGLPANTVSRRVQDLEQHLGARLLQRSTRKLTLTEAGRDLHTRSTDPLQALAQAAQALSDVSQLPSGTVRVAAPADFFNWFQMDWVAEFLAAHPRVRIEWILSDARADLIAEGIDVALRTGSLRDSSLVAKQVGTSSSVLVASPAYLAAHGAPQQLADLQMHDCITRKPASSHGSWRLEGPDGSVDVQVHGRVCANTMDAVVKATLAGLGVSLIPALLAKPLLESGQLRVVLPGYAVHGVGVHCVYPSRHQLPRAVSSFIAFTMDKIQRHCIAA